MEKQNELWFFFQFLQEVEKELSKEEKKQVMIEKAINLKLMCDYVVSCSYGDIVLIICMLRDYVKMLDEVRSDIQWEVYYREKFIKMADRLSEQIEYDYDAALEKCKKKLEKKESSSDVGEEAMALAVKHTKGKKTRIDYMQFVPPRQCSVSDIEKGIFVCYEIKSCKQDVYSGNGLNFLGEKNYIVTTMQCYKDLIPDFNDGTFAKHLHEVAPDSSPHFGIMVAIPFMSEMTDEFENPTEIDYESGRWKLAVIQNCRPGLRKRPMTELLFCMLRSGR